MSPSPQTGQGRRGPGVRDQTPSWVISWWYKAERISSLRGEKTLQTRDDHFKVTLISDHLHWPLFHLVYFAQSKGRAKIVRKTISFIWNKISKWWAVKMTRAGHNAALSWVYFHSHTALNPHSLRSLSPSSGSSLSIQNLVRIINVSCLPVIWALPVSWRAGSVRGIRDIWNKRSKIVWYIQSLRQDKSILAASTADRYTNIFAPLPLLWKRRMQRDF